MSAGSSPLPEPATLGEKLAAFAAEAVTAVARGRTAYFYHLKKKTSGDKSVMVATTPPDIDLDATPPFAFVDCSTWVNYAVSAVAPHHAAAINAAREADIFNPPSWTILPYPRGSTPIPMQEAQQPWARANVATYFFAHLADPANGFTRVTAITDLQAGDLLAWSLGIFADPANPDAVDDPSLTRASDTGHVVIVAGPAVPGQARRVSDKVWPEDFGLGRDPGTGEFYKVYAVPVVDASDLAHAHDSRDYDTLPEPHPQGAKRGGLGSGTLFFSVDASGAPQQFCFNDGSTTPHPDGFLPSAAEATPQKVMIAAARLV